MQEKQSLSIPLAIIIAGALVAFGIYWSGRSDASPKTTTNEPAKVAVSIKSIQPNDHVLGNPSAPIILVEYSDTECPYCKSYHSTLSELMNTYGKDGKLAVVYRHFPVHQKSVNEGQAQECAAELGGNDAFWKFTDKIFATTNSNDTLDSSELPKIAQSIGLDVNAFNACLSNGKYASKIAGDRQDVINAGATGTPYSVIFANGESIPLSAGALPYSDMKNIIDTILKSI